MLQVSSSTGAAALLFLSLISFSSAAPHIHKPPTHSTHQKRALAVYNPPAPWSYAGCYNDSTAKRSLNVGYAPSQAMTDDICMSYCASKGYHYAGTEYASECYCAITLASTAAMQPNTDCNMACKGNATQPCGGSNRLSVFYNPNGPVVNPGPGQWGSMGCYNDTAAGRTLITGVSVSGNTVGVCTAACQKGGYKYAGVEYGQECYCGNTFSNYGAPASDGSFGCSTICQGNSSEYCGGSNRLNVYGFGVAKPSAVSLTSYSSTSTSTSISSSMTTSVAVTTSTSFSTVATSSQLSSESTKSSTTQTSTAPQFSSSSTTSSSTGSTSSSSSSSLISTKTSSTMSPSSSSSSIVPNSITSSSSSSSSSSSLIALSTGYTSSSSIDAITVSSSGLSSSSTSSTSSSSSSSTMPLTTGYTSGSSSMPLSTGYSSTSSSSSSSSSIPESSSSSMPLSTDHPSSPVSSSTSSTSSSSSSSTMPLTTGYTSGSSSMPLSTGYSSTSSSSSSSSSIPESSSSSMPLSTGYSSTSSSSSSSSSISDSSSSLSSSPSSSVNHSGISSSSSSTMPLYTGHTFSATTASLSTDYSSSSSMSSSIQGSSEPSEMPVSTGYSSSSSPVPLSTNYPSNSSSSNTSSMPLYTDYSTSSMNVSLSTAYSSSFSSSSSSSSPNFVSTKSSSMVTSTIPTSNTASSIPLSTGFYPSSSSILLSTAYSSNSLSSSAPYPSNSSSISLSTGYSSSSSSLLLSTAYSSTSSSGAAPSTVSSPSSSRTTSNSSSSISSSYSSAPSSTSSNSKSSVVSSSASSSSSITPGWSALGCYTDNVNTRTLSVGMAVMGGGANMTQENCQVACMKAGYTLAGMEYSQECYCDNTLKNGGGPASDGNAQCTMTCNGNKTQICGGANRLTMFQYVTGLVTATPTTTTGAVTTSATKSATTTAAVPATTTTSSGSGTSLPVGYYYYGCWIDGVNGRILKQANDVSTQTIESCIATCQGQGYVAAGLEYSTQCFCGNAIYSGGVLAKSDSECNMKCGGNSGEICGAGNRLSIYTSKNLTAYQPPSAQTSALPAGWTYRGCYTDSTAVRTLPNQVDITNNTATACLTHCQKFGYPMAGLEFGLQCMCGDPGDVTSSNGVPAPESECNSACPGDSTQTTVCGAGNRMNLYAYNATIPLYNFDYPTGKAAGSYDFLIGGVVIPLITSQSVNGKVLFTEKHGTGPPNSTGAYELDLSLVSQGMTAWRTMKGLKTDVFCSAGLTLPDKVGRQINIGGWSGDSTYGVRLYWPDGSPGVASKNDWQENYKEVALQKGRWYPSALQLSNGSILVVGGEDGSNGAPTPSLEILPNPVGGRALYMDWLERTDPYNLYPFLVVLPSGGIFVQYFNEARILDPITFATIKVLPPVPCHIANPISGRTYPLEGSAMILPQRAPYSDPLTVLLCGGSTNLNQPLDNCVSIQPDAANPQWVLERMPSKRVMSCMTALPDGTYVIMNGAKFGVAGFGLGSNPNHNAVIYDPSKDPGMRMSVMANTTIDRFYHSEAILLQDGRILVSGSDPQTDGLEQEYRVETFSPPYLLKGLAKPSFSMSSTDWVYGQRITFQVAAPNGAVSVSLMGAESSTHGNTMGQRTIFPAVSCSGNTCTVTAPPNANVCPPGWFQVFVLSGGVPSVSQYVRIGGDPANLGSWPNFSDFTVPGKG